MFCTNSEIDAMKIHLTKYFTFVIYQVISMGCETHPLFTISWIDFHKTWVVALNCMRVYINIIKICTLFILLQSGMIDITVILIVIRQDIIIDWNYS